MKLCPICGSVTYFDSFLYTDKCVDCNWKDEDIDEDELQWKNLIKQKEKNRLKFSDKFSKKRNKVKIEIEFNFFLN